MKVMLKVVGRCGAVSVLVAGRTMRIQLVGGSSAPATTRVASGGQGQGQGRGKPRGGQQRGGRKYVAVA